ncbi:MAG: hypothetical protein IJ419_10375 [Agathobacter sp.]|nr:hypothetical protein [Agathobacter sp.]
MKKIIWIGLCAFVLFLTACQGHMESQGNNDASSESTNIVKEENTVMKEVVFLNRIAEAPLKNSNITGFAGVYSLLEFDEEYAPETLFAYQVIWSKHSTDEVVNFLREEGFFILTRGLDTPLIVAGTMEQYKRVFLHNEEYKGFLLGADAAIRPDMEEIVRKVFGENVNDTIYSKEWFDENYHALVPFLGTEKNRVTLTVPVIMPEETTKN